MPSSLILHSPSSPQYAGVNLDVGREVNLLSGLISRYEFDGITVIVFMWIFKGVQRARILVWVIWLTSPPHLGG